MTPSVIHLAIQAHWVMDDCGDDPPQEMLSAHLCNDRLHTTYRETVQVGFGWPQVQSAGAWDFIITTELALDVRDVQRTEPKQRRR